jgi:PAS domain-containing protein
LRIIHEFRYRHADGSWRHLETVCQNRLDDPEIVGVVVNSRDTTERKRAAEALEKSEASLAAAQRIALLGSWDLELADPEKVHGRLHWSDETYSIFGFEPKSVSVTTDFFFAMVHPEDRQRISDAVGETLRNRRPYEIEYRIGVAGGEERIVRERGEVGCDSARGRGGARFQ